MNYKILIWGLICLFFVSCTTSGPKEIFTTVRSTGDVVVPVKYLGGLETLDKKTKGTLYVTKTSTRFVSDDGAVYLNKPTSSIGIVYIKDEVKLNLGKTALRYLFLGPFALLIRDKSELFSLEFKEDEKNPPIYTIFKIKVGTGYSLRSAILTKQELALAEEPVAEKPMAEEPVAERPAARKTELELQWEEAEASDTISAYEDFIRKHASTKFTEKARSRLKELFLEQDWENTRASDTIPKYEQFLKRNPDSKFAEEARSRMDRLNEEEFTKVEKKEIDIPVEKMPKKEASEEISKGKNIGEEAHHLNEFCGEWTCSIIAKQPGIDMLMLFDIAKIELDDSNTINSEFRNNDIKFILEYNPLKKNYFFTYSLKRALGGTEPLLSIDKIELIYSEEAGYTGRVTNEEEKWNLEVTIKIGEDKFDCDILSIFGEQKKIEHNLNFWVKN